MVAEALGEPLDLQDIVAALAVRGELKLHLCIQLCRALEDFHFREHLFAAFRALYGFFPVEAPELFDDFLLVPDFLLLVHIGLELRLAELLLFLGVERVIAVKDGALAVLELDDLGDDAV